jgi:signal transduction histidine kinase
VLRALKNDPRTAVIPFIFLSGAQEHEMIRRGMGLGADDFVTKPFELHELFDSIKARIDRQRQITRKLEDLRVSIALSVPSELFTPLNTILGFSMLVLDGLRAGNDVARDDLADAMTNIHQAGEQLLRIASNYVLYAQLATEEGRPAGKTSPVAHEDWEPRLARAVRKLALRHGRMKDLQYGFEEIALAVKPDHLEKLVCELLDNACKFSRAGQPVRVTGAVRDTGYLLTISDQGRGMTPEEIESLGPMVQVDRVRVMQGGVGLGFAISRALAVRYGGAIVVKPNRDSIGLVVEVALPLPE